MTPAPVKTHWGYQCDVGFDTSQKSLEEQLEMKREKTGNSVIVQKTNGAWLCYFKAKATDTTPKSNYSISRTGDEKTNQSSSTIKHLLNANVMQISGSSNFLLPASTAASKLPRADRQIHSV